MIIKHKVSCDPNVYEAWPDVALTSSGKLVCVFSECTHHCNRDYTRIVTVESSDRGRTWSAKRPVTEGTKGLDYYYNCARIKLLRDGRLCIVVDRLAAGGEENTAGRAVNLLYFSSDDGATWSQPFTTPLNGIVPDKLLELKSGRWILAAHHPQDGFLTQFMRYSDDQGKTWSERITVGSRHGLNLCETSIIESPDGTLVSFMRENSLKGLPAYKAISHDSGCSWGPLHEYPILGCHRPVAGFLKSGELLVTCRFQPSAWIFPPRDGFGGFKGGCQTTLAVLADPATSFQESDNAQLRMMPLDFDRSLYSDTGYTGWVQFADGEIYVVNYIVDDAYDSAQIRGYSFFPEEFVIRYK